MARNGVIEEEAMGYRDEPRQGELYRHFQGKLYQVTAIAQEAVTGARLVVCQAMFGAFSYVAIPYAMFVEKVDMKVYPSSQQTFCYERLTREDGWELRAAQELIDASEKEAAEARMLAESQGVAAHERAEAVQSEEQRAAAGVRVEAVAPEPQRVTAYERAEAVASEAQRAAGVRVDSVAEPQRVAAYERAEAVASEAQKEAAYEQTRTEPQQVAATERVESEAQGMAAVEGAAAAPDSSSVQTEYRGKSAYEQELPYVDRVAYEQSIKSKQKQAFFEEAVNPDLLAFLDAEGCEEKLEVLYHIRRNMDDRLMTAIEASLDIGMPQGDLEQRLQYVRSNLMTRARYENNRLR